MAGGRLIVLFGAAVRPDGSPSPTLRRRIGYARRAAQFDETAHVLCSGAVGKHGRSEASVMVEHLRDHVAPTRLLIDEVSTDTFDSVVAAARLVHAKAYSGCTIISDSYHLPRIALMFRILGVSAKAGPIATGRQGAPVRHWLWMRIREAMATPYDAAITLVKRRALLETFAPAAARDV